MKVPLEMAIDAWLKCPAGQACLASAEAGRVDPSALADMAQKLEVYDNIQCLEHTMRWAAENVRGKEQQVVESIVGQGRDARRG